MTEKDIRWKQRYDNFVNALQLLKMAVETAGQRTLNDLEKQGVIQAFEFTHELSWNLLKDYIEHIGGQNLIGSKDTTREAFQKSLILDGHIWMQMIKSRNLTSHTYNKKVAAEIIEDILHQFYPCFLQLEQKMKSYI
ncbi:MAG: nucleotidyltransferase substrate binding protein [Pseudobdellovibrionaceae bacterium]